MIATMAHEARASLAFLERNFHLSRRYLGWEIVFLVYAVVNTLTISLIGSGDAGRMLYLVVGALLWSFLSVLFHDVAESVAYERWEGTLEYTFMAPIHRATHLVGQCSYAALYALVRTVLLLVVVALTLQVQLGQMNVPAAMITLAVASLPFIGLGLMAATLPLLSPERGPQATHIIQALLLLVSGVYYEIDVLPAWLQPLSRLSPATYTLRAVRRAVLEGAGLAELAGDIAVLFGLGVVLIPLGLRVFARAERHAKIHGKLSRNG